MFDEFLGKFDQYLIDNMYPIEITDYDDPKVEAFVEVKSFSFAQRKIEKALMHFNNEEDTELVGYASDFEYGEKDEDLGVELSFKLSVMKKKEQAKTTDPKKDLVTDSYEEIQNEEKINKLNQLKNKRVVVKKGRKVPIGTEGILFWSRVDQRGYSGSGVDPLKFIVKIGIKADDGKVYWTYIDNVEEVEQKSVKDSKKAKFTVEWLDIDKKQGGAKENEYSYTSVIHGEDPMEVLNKLATALTVDGKRLRFIWVDKIYTDVKDYTMSGDLEHLVSKDKIVD